MSYAGYFLATGDPPAPAADADGYGGTWRNSKENREFARRIEKKHIPLVWEHASSNSDPNYEPTQDETVGDVYHALVPADNRFVLVCRLFDNPAGHRIMNLLLAGGTFGVSPYQSQTLIFDRDHRLQNVYDLNTTHYGITPTPEFGEQLTNDRFASTYIHQVRKSEEALFEVIRELYLHSGVYFTPALAKKLGLSDAEYASYMDQFHWVVRLRSATQLLRSGVPMEPDPFDPSLNMLYMKDIDLAGEIITHAQAIPDMQPVLKALDPDGKAAEIAGVPKIGIKGTPNISPVREIQEVLLEVGSDSNEESVIQKIRDSLDDDDYNDGAQKEFEALKYAEQVRKLKQLAQFEEERARFLETSQFARKKAEEYDAKLKRDRSAPLPKGRTEEEDREIAVTTYDLIVEAKELANSAEASAVSVERQITDLKQQLNLLPNSVTSVSLQDAIRDVRRTDVWVERRGALLRQFGDDANVDDYEREFQSRKAIAILKDRKVQEENAIDQAIVKETQAIETLENAKKDALENNDIATVAKVQILDSNVESATYQLTSNIAKFVSTERKLELEKAKLGRIVAQQTPPASQPTPSLSTVPIKGALRGIDSGPQDPFFSSSTSAITTARDAVGARPTPVEARHRRFGFQPLRLSLKRPRKLNSPSIGLSQGSRTNQFVSAPFPAHTSRRIATASSASSMSAAPEASSSTPADVNMADADAAAAPVPAPVPAEDPVHKSFRAQPSDPMDQDPTPAPTPSPPTGQNQAPPPASTDPAAAAPNYTEEQIASQMNMLNTSLDSIFSPGVELKTHEFLQRLTQAARDMDIVDGWLQGQGLSSFEFPNLDNNTLYSQVQTKLQRIMREISAKSVENVGNAIPGQPLTAEEKASYAPKKIFGDTRMPREQYAVVSATASSVLESRRNAFSRHALEAQATGNSNKSQLAFGSTPVRVVKMGESSAAAPSASPAVFGFREFAEASATPNQVRQNNAPVLQQLPVPKRERPATFRSFGSEPIVKRRAVGSSNPAPSAAPVPAPVTVAKFFDTSVSRGSSAEYASLWGRVNRSYNPHGPRTESNATPLPARMLLPGQKLPDNIANMVARLDSHGVL